MKSAMIAGALVALSGTAFGGSIVGTDSVNLFGFSWPVTHWNVQTDAGNDFEPEGMAFYNGELYVTSDFGNIGVNNRLAKYTPGATGDLSSPSPIQIDFSTPWGAEGITVNNSGSGFGSFGVNDPVRLVSGDSAFESLAEMNLGVNPVTITNKTADGTHNLDDITFVGATDQFAIILDEVTDEFDNVLLPQRIGFYSKFDVLTEVSFFEPIADVKGLTTLSQTGAEILTNQSLPAGDYLLVVSEARELAVYDLAGNQIGATQSLALPLIEEPESVAFDEVNRLLYIGGEAEERIHVVQIPAPSATVIAGLALIGAARRRR